MAAIVEGNHIMYIRYFSETMILITLKNINIGHSPWWFSTFAIMFSMFHSSFFFCLLLSMYVRLLMFEYPFIWAYKGNEVRCGTGILSGHHWLLIPIFDLRQQPLLVERGGGRGGGGQKKKSNRQRELLVNRLIHFFYLFVNETTTTARWGWGRREGQVK